LDTDKKDCLVLDYTGMGHSIFSPEIGEKKTASESVAVQVPCPECGFENDFWGIVDEEGNLVEHFGRKCRGGHVNADTYELTPCGYLFRFKICTQCSAQNDITARDCSNCGCVLIDPDTKLKQARLSKDAHVLTPDSIEMLERVDKKGTPYLQVKYYDYDAQFVAEMYYLNNATSLKKFAINFLRSHMRKPELKLNISSVSDAVKIRSQLRMPSFVIARKQGKFWKITEKIFSEEL
jgi:DNA repair protein RadD